MSGLVAVLLGIPALKKRESPIAPFIRTANLAEAEHKKALDKLECATKELIAAVEEKEKPCDEH